MALSKTEKIESIKEQITQLQNQQKRLIQEQKAQERKDRTKRLCKRAGLLESLIPDTISLTNEQFNIFLEKVILTDSTRRTLTEIKTGKVNHAAPIRASAAARADTADEGKNGTTEQGNG